MTARPRRRARSNEAHPPEDWSQARTSRFDSAPQRRESSVEEGSTRIVVDRSGSWRAAWSGNWLGWSLATKVASGG